MTPVLVRRLASPFSLRRIVTSNRYLPEVDGFRFLAILMVVLAHVVVQCLYTGVTANKVPEIYRVEVGGVRGVYLFFTISGFILAMPFARHHLAEGRTVGLGSYFRRRLTRLEPPFIVAMLIRFPLVMLTKHIGFRALAPHLFFSLFYLHNLVYGRYSSINPPAWSLEIEVQFYILAPLLASVFFVRNKAFRRLAILAAVIACALISLKLGQDPQRQSLTLLSYLQYFLAGFLLCDVYLLDDMPHLPRWLWDLFGAAALSWILLERNPLDPLLIPLATLVLYFAGFYGLLVRAIFSWTPLALLGGMCYSLYLTHGTVLAAITPFVIRAANAPVPEALQYALILLLALGSVFPVGILYFVLLERPCMDPVWPQKLLGRLRGQQ